MMVKNDIGSSSNSNEHQMYSRRAIVKITLLLMIETMMMRTRTRVTLPRGRVVIAVERHLLFKLFPTEESHLLIVTPRTLDPG